MFGTTNLDVLYCDKIFYSLKIFKIPIFSPYCLSIKIVSDLIGDEKKTLLFIQSFSIFNPSLFTTFLLCFSQAPFFVSAFTLSLKGL